MTKESRGVGRCCSRTDFTNLFTRPRDSRKACCTRGHVFEIQEIDSSLYVCVCVSRLQPRGGRVHSNYSILTHDARKPRVRRFRFYKTLCVRPSRAIHAPLRARTRGKDYQNARTKRTVYANEHATNIYERDRWRRLSPRQNESTSLQPIHLCL